VEATNQGCARSSGDLRGAWFPRPPFRTRVVREWKCYLKLWPGILVAVVVFVGGAQFLDGWWPLVPLVAVLALLFVAEAR